MKLIPVIKLKIQKTKGETIGQTKNTTIIKSGNVYALAIFSKRLNLSGNNEKRIPEPSSGGTGTALKTASKIFKNTISADISITEAGITKNIDDLIISEKKVAIIKFTTIPAIETKNKAFFLVSGRKLAEFTGTGFAQPNKNPAFVTTKIIGNSMEPKRSKCGIGFMVNLPAILAV